MLKKIVQMKFIEFGFPLDPVQSRDDACVPISKVFIFPTVTQKQLLTNFVAFKIYSTLNKILYRFSRKKEM